MRDTFCFPHVEEAALFAATHNTAVLYMLTVAHFDIFFVTLHPMPKITKFHERIAH